MSTLVITLSGPRASESQARNALVAAQFDNSPPDHDYGLPPASDQQAESFITVHGEDVDKAWDAVRSLGWQLRVHHEKPEYAKPSLDQLLGDKFGEYERRIANLEAQLQNPPMRGGAVESPGFANQNSTYGAEITRRAIASLLQRGASIGSITGGIVGSGDCTLTPPGSGMSVNTASGEVWVPGSSAATQSGYYCRVSSSTNLAIAASDPSNPRVDREAAVVTDSAYAGGTNTFALAIVTGTPTAGATLVNLNGVGAAPASSYTLGYVLVPATSTNVTGGNISNVATQTALGLLPPANTFVAPGSYLSIPTSQAVTSTTYTTLATADQITGLSVPAGGMIAVWYQATWQESVSGAARAAIFIGANQMKVVDGDLGASVTQAASFQVGATAGTNRALSSGLLGLATYEASGFTGDVTTGQAAGFIMQSSGYTVELAGTIQTIAANSGPPWGGPCYIDNLPAGTYSVAVQFKSSSGSVTASNRRLRAMVLPF